MNYRVCKYIGQTIVETYKGSFNECMLWIKSKDYNSREYFQIMRLVI